MASIIFDLSMSETNLQKTYIFKDISVDLKTDNKNLNIEASTDVNAIECGIKNMFLFSQGERILNPEFGNSLYQYLYEPINDLTANRIGKEIISMFDRWEPRCVIKQILIIPYVDQNMYYVQVYYTVPALGDTVLNFSASLNARR